MTEQTMTVRFWVTATVDGKVAVAITDPDLERESLVLRLTAGAAHTFGHQLIAEASNAKEGQEA
jgi:hypothetical protein